MSSPHRTLGLLDPRCTTCRGPMAPDVPIVNYGDLQFHVGCGPTCSMCQRRLLPGEGGWGSEGRVVSEPWGYGIRPTHFWCPECLGSVLRSRPRGDQ